MAALVVGPHFKRRQEEVISAWWRDYLRSSRLMGFATTNAIRVQFTENTPLLVSLIQQSDKLICLEPTSPRYF
jgi:hypothetical protein